MRTGRGYGQAFVAWFKRWVLDGWITTGPQIFCDPGEVRVFTKCLGCNRIFPHWLASMKASETKKRGYIGCKCGGLRIQPIIIPSWQAFWWVFIRGWLIRRVCTRQRLWDPRMPLMTREMQ